MSDINRRIKHVKYFSNWKAKEMLEKCTKICNQQKQELISEFLKSWKRFEKMFDDFEDVWHIENKVWDFIELERKKWEDKEKEKE